MYKIKISFEDSTTRKEKEKRSAVSLKDYIKEW